MASEVIKLNLIPKGEMPVFHASQFDSGRLITCELYRGEDAYSVPEGYTVELHCRKVDNNIVTMASTLINDNVVTFTSTEQLTACNGNNLCEVAILDEGYRIGTLNFILEVEIDPLKGGITSTSEIHNLETQVEEITTEIIGENYYNKTEVDDLLDAKADASSVYTKSETDTKLALKANASDVYTKSQTDMLLNAKANSSDVYTKGQVDTALAGKADVSDLPDMDLYYTKTATDTLLAAKADASTVTASLATKADKSDTYTKEQVDALIENIYPTLTASGPIASFTTALTKPMVSVTAAAGADKVIHISGVPDTAVYFKGVFGGTYGFINLGEITPTMFTISAGNLFRYSITGIKKTTESTAVPNDLVYGYTTVSNSERTDKTLSQVNNTYGVDIIDNDYTSAEDFKAHMSGVYLIFELETAATPSVSEQQFEALCQSFHISGSINELPISEMPVTYSGSNNVFGNTGDISVSYKYMSI